MDVKLLRWLESGQPNKFTDGKMAQWQKGAALSLIQEAHHEVKAAGDWLIDALQSIAPRTTWLQDSWIKNGAPLAIRGGSFNSPLVCSAACAWSDAWWKPSSSSRLPRASFLRQCKKDQLEIAS